MRQWRESTVGAEATLQRGFDITRDAQRPGRVPVVSSGGISSYHDTAAVRAPGVVIGRKGTLGTVFYLEEDYWPHDTTLWVRDFHGNEPRFVYYFFKLLKVTHLDVGSANPTLNRNHVHPIQVTWPGIELQRAIVSILGALDDKIECNRRINQTLEAMMHALYKNWFVDFEPFRSSDFVETTLGVIPQGWKVTTIGELCDMGNGAVQTGPFGSQLHASDYVDDGIPVVMPVNLGNNRIIEDNIARVSAETQTHLSRHRLAEGDIVYGRRGDIGRRAYVRRDEEGWLCGTGCLRIRFGSAPINPFLVSLYLGQEKVKESILAKAVGTTMPNLNTGVLRSIPLPLPPIEIQNQVVGILNDWDSLITLNHSTSHSLARTRDYLLPKLLSGEIEVQTAEEAVEAVV